VTKAVINLSRPGRRRIGRKPILVAAGSSLCPYRSGSSTHQRGGGSTLPTTARRNQAMACSMTVIMKVDLVDRSDGASLWG